MLKYLGRGEVDLPDYMHLSSEGLLHAFGIRCSQNPAVATVKDYNQPSAGLLLAPLTPS